MPEEKVTVVFIDITRQPPSVQFLICSGFAFAFYLIYGYLQELIFRLEGFRHFGWYLTFIQFGCYTLFGIVALNVSENASRKVPLPTYSFLAFVTVATMGLSNTSVGYLNYPTQVIFKCCKLIPVLIGGIVIQGKRFGALDVSACILMSVGLILFALADNSVSPAFNAYGVVLISLALCADAVIGNVQEKTMKLYLSSNSEMVLYSYGIGVIYIFCGLLLSGQFVPAFLFCLEHPVETYGYAVLFSASGYLGVNVVLTLVKNFGALTAVTVTTFRKAVTIILSFFFFSKPFTYHYITAGLIVVLGIYLNVYSKNKMYMDSKYAELYRHVKLSICQRGKHRLDDATMDMV